MKLVASLVAIAATAAVAGVLKWKAGNKLVDQICDDLEKTRPSKPDKDDDDSEYELGIVIGNIGLKNPARKRNYYLVGEVIIMHDTENNIFTVGNKRYDDKTLDQMTAMVANTDLTTWLNPDENDGRPVDVSEFFELYPPAVKACISHLMNRVEEMYANTRATRDDFHEDFELDKEKPDRSMVCSDGGCNGCALKDECGKDGTPPENEQPKPGTPVPDETHSDNEDPKAEEDKTE